MPIFRGNRIGVIVDCSPWTHIVDLIAPEHWGREERLKNPADCASRKLTPSELLSHGLWWSGPSWLRLDPSTWPRRPKLKPDATSEEVDELCLYTVATQLDSVISLERYCAYTNLVRVIAWVIHFVRNCWAHQKGLSHTGSKELSENSSVVALTDS